MENTKALEVIQENNIEETTGQTLMQSFSSFFKDAEEWVGIAKNLKVTDVSQVEEMEQAREARLALKAIRVGADKVRKALKEDSLRYGKAVQGIYNILACTVEPAEQYLEEQEKFVERKEQERKAKLKANREMDLQPYAEFVVVGIDLGELSEEDYQKMLSGVKLQMQTKLDAEAKIEAERIAKEEADKKEQERIRAENEKLLAEKAEAEKKAKIEAEERAKEDAKRLQAEQEAKRLQEEQAKKEREDYEAKLEAERKEKERVEAELKAKQDLEQAELEAKRKAEERAKNAPDREKLLAFAEAIRAIQVPEVQGEKAKEILSKTIQLIIKTHEFIVTNTNKL